MLQRKRYRPDQKTHFANAGEVVASPLRSATAPPSGSLGAIVGSFKAATAKRINNMRGSPGAPVWQRNYYEHIIRDEGDLARIRQYIRDNPARWDEDEENPMNVPRSYGLRDRTL